MSPVAPGAGVVIAPPVAPASPAPVVPAAPVPEVPAAPVAPVSGVVPVAPDVPPLVAAGEPVSAGGWSALRSLQAPSSAADRAAVTIIAVVLLKVFMSTPFSKWWDGRCFY